MNSDARQISSSPPKAAFGVLALIIAFVGFIAWGLSESNRTQPVSGPAPDFMLSLFDGYDGGLGKSPVALSELRGKVVLINFWASWCVPCEEEAPDLEAAWREYKDRGVVFIGVDWTDNHADALTYLQRFGITYANGPDLETKIGPKYHITGVPETFIVDQQGEIVFFQPSPVEQQALAVEFEKLLAGQ
ncbi:MAG TPA: TlpA disulfide reductase family protein [Anaerolineae bacterium]|nr:TlpA disulfide reductase family protein [Anaerolineae bacterium]